MSMGEDITERREAEEKLRSSEERFRGIFDQASPSPCRSFAIPRDSRRDSPASSRTLRRVAERTAELEEANGKLEKLATEDGLTGLANRRHLDATIDRELSRGLRTGDMLSFLMCDVDFFKRYNDRYGHGEGDLCLKRIGAALRCGRPSSAQAT